MKGKIHFTGFKPKHTVERAIASEMERWFSQETHPAHSGNCFYSVHVTSEGDLPFYYCRVDAVIGDCRWLSNEAGKSPLTALANSLKKMRVCRGPVPRTAPTLAHAIVA